MTDEMTDREALQALLDGEELVDAEGCELRMRGNELRYVDYASSDENPRNHGAGNRVRTDDIQLGKSDASPNSAVVSRDDSRNPLNSAPAGTLKNHGTRTKSGHAPIAALYVQPDGCYQGLSGVDPWDEARDARKYAGPHPVVAHPPCARWSRLAGLVQHRWGHRKGDDGGCFKAALAAVRRWGGVLEHPAYSDAWAAFDLPRPHPGGGWQRGLCGGWSCHVEQVHYGHRARKATWLYAYGAEWLPSLAWGGGESAMRRAPSGRGGVELMGKQERSATPHEFRDMLIAIARSAGGGEDG